MVFGVGLSRCLQVFIRGSAFEPHFHRIMEDERAWIHQLIGEEEGLGLVLGQMRLKMAVANAAENHGGGSSLVPRFHRRNERFAVHEAVVANKGDEPIGAAFFQGDEVVGEALLHLASSVSMGGEEGASLPVFKGDGF